MRACKCDMSWHSSLSTRKIYKFKPNLCSPIWSGHAECSDQCMFYMKSNLDHTQVAHQLEYFSKHSDTNIQNIFNSKSCKYLDDDMKIQTCVCNSHEKDQYCASLPKSIAWYKTLGTILLSASILIFAFLFIMFYSLVFVVSHF